MKPESFEFFRQFLHQKSGLVVTPEKTYLLESRLMPLCRENNMATLDDLADHLRKLPLSPLSAATAEAMTVNETSFFRDLKPFTNFEQVILPYLLEKRASQRKVRIWCAAASSGQEPYSLAMTIREKAGLLAGWNTDILGTDLSNDILSIARRGIYSQFEVQRGLPIQYLMKYFKQDGDKWALSDDIKKMIRYQPFNLLESMAGLGTFDIVFCRNVLIYFDEATKRDILARIAKQLAPDGFLLLGGAETVIGISQAFLPLPGRHGVYVMPGHPLLTSAAPPARAATA